MKLLPGDDLIGSAYARHLEKKAALTPTRNTALNFSFAAALAAGIAGVIALASVIGSFSGNPSLIGWICVGSFLALAIGLYLIAQVVHIRANTEK